MGENLKKSVVEMNNENTIDYFNDDYQFDNPVWDDNGEHVRFIYGEWLADADEVTYNECTDTYWHGELPEEIDEDDDEAVSEYIKKFPYVGADEALVGIWGDGFTDDMRWATIFDKYESAKDSSSELSYWYWQEELEEAGINSEEEFEKLLEDYEIEDGFSFLFDCLFKLLDIGNI